MVNSQMLKQCRLLYHHLHLTSDLLPVITGEQNQFKHLKNMSQKAHTCSND